MVRSSGRSRRECYGHLAVERGSAHPHDHLREADTEGGDRVVSRLLPPWLDTPTAVAPQSIARRASSGCQIPLTMNGPPHTSASHFTSSQVGRGVATHSPKISTIVLSGPPTSPKFGTVRSGNCRSARKLASQAGRESAMGANRIISLRFISAGIAGEPQSRACQGSASTVRMSAFEPAFACVRHAAEFRRASPTSRAEIRRWDFLQPRLRTDYSQNCYVPSRQTSFRPDSGVLDGFDRFSRHDSLLTLI